MKLTAKQERFCQEYIVDFNATQAAIRAGYSKKTAIVQASQTLTKLNVQKRIEELTSRLQKKTDISREMIIAEYAKIAFTDIRDYFDENSRLLPIKDLSDKAAAALSGIEVDELWGYSPDGKIQIGDTKKIKRWDKIKALEGLAKVYGYYAPEKSEVKIDNQPFSDSQVEKILHEIKSAKR